MHIIYEDACDGLLENFFRLNKKKGKKNDWIPLCFEYKKTRGQVPVSVIEMSTGYVDTKPCRVFFSARMNGSSSSSCRSLSFSFHIDRDEYPAPVHASVAGMTPIDGRQERRRRPGVEIVIAGVECFGYVTT